MHALTQCISYFTLESELDQEVACVSIPITSDSTHEPPEDFIVDLETPHNVEKGEPSMATVTIIDDDGMAIHS